MEMTSQKVLFAIMRTRI